MCIGIFSFRAFDRRLARLAAPISSGVRQGGAESAPPPAGRVRLNTPAGRGLTRQLLGYFATRDLLGGGDVKRPHVITRERMAAERRATRRSKALDETILKHPLNFPNEITCQVKVRSKVKIGAFRLRAVDLKIISFGPKLTPNTPKYRARN